MQVPLIVSTTSPGAIFLTFPQEKHMTGLEKIIRFGNVYQTNATGSTNTLFGDLQMPDVVRPKIPTCEPWTLTELLDHEKEVTGMFMSGHPLDHFRFEIEHYGITGVAEFNEIKEAVSLQTNPGRPVQTGWPGSRCTTPVLKDRQAIWVFSH